MLTLEHLSPKQRDLIISLPYRVGLWVSQADQQGGDDADDAELRTLENLINGFTQDVFGSELVQNVMAETWAQKARWPEWSKGVKQTLPDCKEAISILQDHYESKEISAFRQRLYDIAEAVAMAFNEGETGTAEKQSSFIEKMVEKLKSIVLPKASPQITRLDYISQKEGKALKQLSGVLDLSLQ